MSVCNVGRLIPQVYRQYIFLLTRVLKVYHSNYDDSLIYYLFCELRYFIKRQSGGLQTYARARSQQRTVVEELKFVIQKSGELTYQLIAMCDSYDGVDIIVDVVVNGRTFTIQIHLIFVVVSVLPRNKIKREIFVHPEDEALDNQPTLFQQMLGEAADGHSEDESED